MADSDSWDADNFEPDEPTNSGAGRMDRWEGEDEEDEVKDNWDDEEEEQKEAKTLEAQSTETKSTVDKVKKKELNQKKKMEENKKRETQIATEHLTPEQQQAEKLRQKKMQEAADMELAREAFGVDPAAANTPSAVITANSVCGVQAMCPSSREDFLTFEKLLKEKITQFEKSAHYSGFLESLFRELCISLEVDDLKKISNSLTVLLNEKQKQEKEKKATKKKKKGVVPGGGLKANMRDDFADYGNFDGGYGNDYDDFM